uniref:Uncharacterized protein n=1 Tax=Clastoptera arizonana TaxID=38151 RepID=A0A1B6E2A2_9HEMI
MGKVKDKLVFYKKQNYNELKKHHLEQKTLFIDPTFPAVDSIIGTSSIPPNILWKRPSDICSDPRLFVDIETSRTVRPGELSCNWIVSACAVLAGVRELCNRVIPNYWEQEWPTNYCGMFRFQFWRYGVWTQVVVDDLLPTVDNVLLTTQAGSENEFWAPLLEKAYAKLYGSYDALREGHLSDALVDFTGGVSEVVDIDAGEYSVNQDKRSALFDKLLKEISEHSIMCFTIVAPTLNDIGMRTDLGINKGHAYHVTAVKRVHLGETGLRSLFRNHRKSPLLRLRDPREKGRTPPSLRNTNSPEEEGEYVYTTAALTRLLSSNIEWSKVKESERQRLGLTFNEKSEFWMPFEDVVSEFTELTICRLLNRNLFSYSGRNWYEAAFVDAWRTGMKGSKNDRAGGGEETLLRNPQYICDILKSEEELVVQLMQIHDLDSAENIAFLNFLIGFSIIKVEENRTTRLHKQWDHCPTVVKLDYKRKREVNYRGVLVSGRYILIPNTYKPDETAGFMLRFFSSSNINVRELQNDLPRNSLSCSCLSGEPEWVTVITIHKADGLVRPPGRWTTKLNPYCVVTSEGSKVKTRITLESDPVWDASFVFYRKSVDKPLLIQVYSRNMVMLDTLIGERELPALVTHSPTALDITLTPRSAADATASVGTLQLTILTEDNLMAV